MRAAVAFLAAVAAACAFSQGKAPKAVERVYSPVITNLAWDIYKVEVRDGRLFDPTGTITARADLEYLYEVARGMQSVLESGSNAFVRADAEFRASLAANPPPSPTHVSMVMPPHSDASPEARTPYGMIVAEEGTNVSWYLSKPFSLKPQIVCETQYIDGSGYVVTNYDVCAFPDYFNDATNFPARTVGDWPRTVRMFDPPVPDGVRFVIRDSHLHYGHPKSGMNWGNMEVYVAGTNGTVRPTVTGTFTNRVNGVAVEEVVIRNGAFVKKERLQ